MGGYADGLVPDHVVIVAANEVDYKWPELSLKEKCNQFRCPEA